MILKQIGPNHDLSLKIQPGKSALETVSESCKTEHSRIRNTDHRKKFSQAASEMFVTEKTRFA